MTNPDRMLKAIACKSFLGLALGLLPAPAALAQDAWSKLASQPFAAPGASANYKPDNPLYQLTAGAGKLVFAANGDGLQRSSDGGGRWSVSVASGFVMSNALKADVSGLVLFNRQISRDGGLAWTDLPQSITIIPSAFAIRNGTVITGGYYNNIFGSFDAARTFTRLRSGPDVAWPTAMEISPQGRLYSGLYTGGTFFSDDNGKTWSDHVGPIRSDVEKGFIPAGADKMTSLRLSADGQLYAGYFGLNGSTGTLGLFRVSPDLKTSALVEGGFPRIGVTGLVRGPSGALFAGTWGMGVHRSTDAGKTWISLNTGLGGLHVLALEINSEATLFAVTREGTFSMAKAEGTPASLRRNHKAKGAETRRAAVLDFLLGPAEGRFRPDGRFSAIRRIP